MKQETCAQRLLAGVCLLLPIAIHAAEPASAADKVFAGKASQSSAYQVEASKVAMMRAISPDLKDLATIEVRDHEDAGADLRRITSAAGVAVAPQLSAEWTQRLARLKAVPPSHFYAAYFSDMKQIHRKDEELFATEARKGSSSFRTFAQSNALRSKVHARALKSHDNNPLWTRKGMLYPVPSGSTPHIL